MTTSVTGAAFEVVHLTSVEPGSGRGELDGGLTARKEHEGRPTTPVSASRSTGARGLARIRGMIARKGCATPDDGEHAATAEPRGRARDLELPLQAEPVISP
jgi:hypothetical protein